MAYKEIDDRQVINRSALTDSIGSSANTTLDVLFGLIDSKMVNLNGVQTLTNKTLAFLQTNIITDSTTTGSAATLPSGDIMDGVVRLTNTSLTSISGITAGGTSQFITIENQTGNTITVNNNDSGASVGNRIYTGTGTGIALLANTTVTLNYDPTIAYWMLQGVTSGAKSAPTTQIFLTGSGTYTTPFPTPLYLKIEMVGGGGAGAGGGPTGNSGTSGGTTSFGTSFLTCTGGSGGAGGDSSGATGGIGGTFTITGGMGFSGSGWNGAGGEGGSLPYNASIVSMQIPGGLGGSGPFGGAGNVQESSNGGNAATNSGSGGGGGGMNSSSSWCGGGGAAGAYISGIITTPLSTYAYAVGSDGIGGSGGVTVGGNGAAGIIIITEFYQ